MSKRGFGSVRQLPSKRYQARYTGPDERMHSAPHTFDSKADAEGWLADRRKEITAGTWSPNGPTTVKRVATFQTYSDGWLAARTLKPRTREHYRKLLDQKILPDLGSLPLQAITPDVVRDWHTGMGTGTPTMRAHAYSLARSVLHDAVADGLIPANPCHVRGAGNSKRVHKIKPATLAELGTLVDSMTDNKYKLMTLLAAWCALRFGELAELRRHDIDLKNGVIHVRRGVVRAEGENVVGTPKSAAGHRDVNIPPHLLPMVKAYLAANVNGREGLLFPAADGKAHLAPSTLYRVFYRARVKAGRPDLRFHDLRHTGAVLAASTGATLAELMARLGHSTAGAALRYQHASEGRDKIIAERLSALAGGGQ